MYIHNILVEWLQICATLSHLACGNDAKSAIAQEGGIPLLLNICRTQARICKSIIISIMYSIFIWLKVIKLLSRVFWYAVADAKVYTFSPVQSWSKRRFEFFGIWRTIQKKIAWAWLKVVQSTYLAYYAKQQGFIQLNSSVCNKEHIHTWIFAPTLSSKQKQNSTCMFQF